MLARRCSTSNAEHLLLAEATPKSTSCNVCHEGLDASKRDCAECASPVHSHCSAVFLLSSYGESLPKVVCETCQPKIKKEVAKLRGRTPIETSLFTPEERTRIEQGKLGCENCAENFSVFRGPQKCSNCSDIICFKCCFDFADVPHLMTLEGPKTSSSATVCRSCWAGVKRRLLLEGKTVAAVGGDGAALAMRIRQEVSLGEKFLVELTANDIKNPLEGKKSADEVRREQCPHCKQAFGVWVPPVACGRCSKLVCAGKCCSQFFAMLDGSQCRACWGAAKADLQNTLSQKRDSEAATLQIRNHLDVGTYWLETITPAQLLDSTRSGRRIERMSMSSLQMRKRTIGGASCSRCLCEFDQGEHRFNMCTECKGDVCNACGKDYVLKSAGETAARFICDVCEHAVRAKLGKMQAPVLPAAAATVAPPVAVAAPTPKKEVPPPAAIDARMALLKQKSKALSHREMARATVRPMADVQKQALLELQQSHYFDTLSSQTWSRICTFVAAPGLVGPLASVNTAMRDLLSGWACLLHFDQKQVLEAKRQVVPGINEATSHISTEEIVTLKFGLTTTLQVFRFRPVVEPRFEKTLLESQAPKFGLGAALASDGQYIAIRGKSSSEVGKPIAYSVFRIQRKPGSGGKIEDVPFVATITSQATRAVVEVMHRGVLLVAYHDKAGSCYVLEAFSCATNKLIRRVTHTTAYASARVVKMVVEARHVYMLCADDGSETPFLLISHSLDLIFESSFPLEASWDSKIFFCKHHALYYDAKAKAIQEIAMDIQRGATRVHAAYAYKLKRKEEIRTILVDSTKAVVIDSTQHCAVYLRASQRLAQSFSFPSDVVSVTPLQSHLVVIANTDAGKGGSGGGLRAGLVSPRKKEPNAALGSSSTQADVYKLK